MHTIADTSMRYSPPHKGDKIRYFPVLEYVAFNLTRLANTVEGLCVCARGLG